MSNYTITKRPTLLGRGDHVTFTVGDKTLEYTVEHRYLNAIHTANRKVFNLLGLGADTFSGEAYGYTAGGGDWPEFKDNDYAAATSLINALFDEIAKREPEQAPLKVGDVVVMTRTNEPGYREGERCMLTRCDHDGDWWGDFAGLNARAPYYTATCIGKSEGRFRLAGPKDARHPNPLVRAMLRATLEMAERMAKVKAEPKITDEKANAMAKIIKESDFGCQRENVAKLMEAATGKPVVDAYKNLGKTGDGGEIPKDDRIAGAVMAFTKDFSNTVGRKAKQGELALVWTNKTMSLRRGPHTSDIFEAYRTDLLRPATVEEIIAYIKADHSWIKSEGRTWMGDKRDLMNSAIADVMEQ